MTFTSALTAVSSKGINAIAEVKSWGRFSTTSTSLVDVTGATVNITTTKTCTLFAIAYFSMSGSVVSAQNVVSLFIDTTKEGNIVTGTSVTSNEAIGCCVFGKKSGLVAGTYTTKIQLKSSAGANTSMIEGPNVGAMAPDNGIIVIAIEE